MRDPLANVLGSIPPRRGTRIVHHADLGVLVDVALTPTARWRPAGSAAELAAELAGAVPAHLWDFASPIATGAGLVDLVGGVNLEPSGGAVLERRAAGLFNGADFRSIRVVELTDIGPICAAATFDQLDPDAAPFAFALAFAIGKRPASSAGLAGKLDGEGWALRLEPSGNLTFYVNDSATITALPLTGDHADGAWHVAVVYRSGTTIGLYSDLTAPSSTTIVGLGSLACPGVFSLGTVEVYPSARAQLAFAAYYAGSSVAPLVGTGGRAAALAWWADQVAGHGPGWAFARSGPSSSRYDTDAEGGAVVAIAAPGAPAWLRMDGPSGPHGALLGSSYTPITLYTDPADTAGWSRLGSPTVDVDVADGPRLFLDAVRLGKSTGNPTGRLSLSVALTAGTTYHFGIWVRWDGAGPGTVGVDAGPVWRIRDAGDATTLHVLGTSTVGRWHWHVVTYTAATTATHRIQYLASADTEDTAGDVLIQYASGGTGAQPRMFPGLAAGAAATTGATTATATIPTSGAAHRGDRGSILVDAVALDGLPVAAAQRALVAVYDDGAGGDNARQLSLAPGTTSGPRARVELFDGSVADPDQVTNEIATATWRTAGRWALLWDRAQIPGAGGGRTWMIERDGAGIAGGAGTHAIVASFDGDTLAIGTSAPGGSTAGPWIGGIQRARVLSGAVIGCSSPTGTAPSSSPEI